MKLPEQSALEILYACCGDVWQPRNFFFFFFCVSRYISGAHFFFRGVGGGGGGGEDFLRKCPF